MHCTRNVIVDNEINFSALFLKKCFSSVVQSWKRINKNKSYFANFVLSLYNKYKSSAYNEQPIKYIFGIICCSLLLLLLSIQFHQCKKKNKNKNKNKNNKL